MNTLELCKKFAELEGVEFDEELSVEEVRVISHYFHGERQSYEYNPITDLALNCAARDKYELEIDYKKQKVFINTFRMLDIEDACYYRGEDVCKVVIECILKSEGML